MYDQPQPNYVTQPNYPAPAHVVGNHRQVDWRLMGAYIIAALGVGCAIVCLWFLASFKQVYASQMAKMNHALSTAQAAQSKDAKNVKDLNERFDGMAGIVNAISAYSLVCSQDLEGQNGPTRFFFACSTHQPGSGS